MPSRIRRSLAAALFGAVALSGCDVALIAYFASKDDSAKTPGAPDLRYRVYVRNLGAADLNAENVALTGATTPPAPWTFVATTASTIELNLTSFSADTVLLWNLERDAYQVDAIEEISAQGSTLRTATMPEIKDDDIDNEDRVAGYPNGIRATLAAPPTDRAHLFAKFPSNLGRVRISAYVTPGAGDVIRTDLVARGTNQIAGGVGLSNAGVTYASFIDAGTRNVFLQRIDAAGLIGAEQAIETTTNAGVGTPAVAVDQVSSFVYVGSTVNNGDIRVQKFNLAMTVLDSSLYELATPTVEFLEWNGLAVDPSGNLAIAGAITGAGIDSFADKVTSTGSGVWAIPPASPIDAGDSWWYGVSCDVNGHVFLTGDITEGGPATDHDMITRRVTSTGTNDWTATPSNAGQVDRGHAVVADAGNVWVGGFSSTAGLRNGIIRKYSSTGVEATAPFPLTIAGAAGQDDEILDLAADADGNIYAVGYEIHDLAARGRDWWIRKINPAGTTLWTRTYHHGQTGGNDRAVSIAVTGDIVVVSGEVTIAGGSTEIHVRRYQR